MRESEKGTSNLTPGTIPNYLLHTDGLDPLEYLKARRKEKRRRKRRRRKNKKRRKGGGGDLSPAASDKVLIKTLRRKISFLKYLHSVRQQ